VRAGTTPSATRAGTSSAWLSLTREAQGDKIGRRSGVAQHGVRIAPERFAVRERLEELVLPTA